MSKFYNGLIRLVRFVLPDMETVWEEPFDSEAAVFCPNHAASFGPIAMCAFFSLRDQCHPWLNAGIMERKEIPAYVRQDYWWEPGCFFEPLLNMTLPYLMALLLPPILGSVPGVPVYHDNRVIRTFRKSLEYVAQGHHLVIFSEQPAGHGSSEMELNRGFLQVAPLICKRTGKALKFYPVHVDRAARRITVSKPVPYDPALPLKEQEDGIIQALSKSILGK